MQLASRQSTARQLADKRALLYHGWLRAGYIGFAYRLAHLCVPKHFATLGVATAFFFI